MSTSEEVVERAARAAHAHNNSGVNADISPLSWDNEQPALKKWHRSMASVVLDALHADGLILYQDEYEQIGWAKGRSPSFIEMDQFEEENQELVADALTKCGWEPVFRRVTKPALVVGNEQKEHNE